MAADFWQHIDSQLERLRAARTADDVLAILPKIPGTSAGDGFFEGSGGDGTVSESLLDAGWNFVWRQAGYYWCMKAPNGDAVTYIEGDLYRGDQGVSN